MSSSMPAAVRELPFAEKLQLVEALWDDLARFARADPIVRLTQGRARSPLSGNTSPIPAKVRLGMRSSAGCWARNERQPIVRSRPSGICSRPFSIMSRWSQVSERRLCKGWTRRLPRSRWRRPGFRKRYGEFRLLVVKRFPYGVFYLFDGTARFGRRHCPAHARSGVHPPPAGTLIHACALLRAAYAAVFMLDMAGSGLALTKAARPRHRFAPCPSPS